MTGGIAGGLIALLLLLLCILIAVLYVRKRRLRDNRHLELFKVSENAVNPSYIPEFAAVIPSRDLFQHPQSFSAPRIEPDEIQIDTAIFDTEPKFRFTGPSLLQHGFAFKLTAAILEEDVAKAEAQRKRKELRDAALDRKIRAGKEKDGVNLSQTETNTILHLKTDE